MSEITDSNFDGNDNAFFNSTVKLRHKTKKVDFIKPKTILQTTFGRCNQPNSKYYFTSDRLEKDMLVDECFIKPELLHEAQKQYFFKSLLKEKDEIERKCNKNKNYLTRQTYNSSLNNNIRKRLNVDCVARNIETIVEINPEFYSLIEGRPIKYNSCIKSYVEELKSSATSHLKAGFLNDEVLQFQENFLEEQTKYNEISKKHNDCVEHFEEFLKEDYQNSMQKINESDIMNKKLMTKNEELQKLNEELGIIFRKLYILEEKCRLAKIYQEFLGHVSPLEWRQEHGINGDDLEPIQKIKNIFLKYEPELIGHRTLSLTSLISIFKKSFDNDEVPQLYFTEPHQLKACLRYIKTQMLTNWSNYEKLSEMVDNMKKSINLLIDSITEEYSDIEESIADLTEIIEQEEKYANCLKQKVVKIIHINFGEIVSSEDTLKFNICVEDIYEKIIFQNISFETFEMMKTLEREYEINMMKLDYINSEIVLFVKKQCYSEDIKVMKMARDASMKLKKLEKLITHMKKCVCN